MYFFSYVLQNDKFGWIGRFLINKSKINKEFIKDFFGLQKKKIYEEYAPFTIDLDNVAKWLYCKKYTLKETLSESYSKKLDFIIVKGLLKPNLGQKKHK